MGDCPPSLQRLLAWVTTQVRRRRAEHGAWRGAFWGALLAAAMLASQTWLQVWLGAHTEIAALVVLLALTLAGAAWGATRPMPQLASARLADRVYGLQDRLSTALEWSLAPAWADKPMARAQLADTIAAVERLERSATRTSIAVIPRILPREARWLVMPLVLIAALISLPPLHAPAALMRSAVQERVVEERAVSLLDRVKLLGQDLLKREQQVQPETQRHQEQAQSAPADATEFKDKALSRRETGNMDFAAFAKKGDERLRLLEHADKLPDLQSDFASSDYRALAKRAQELAAAKPGQMSNARLGQVLKEMERVGRKNPEIADDLNEAMQSFEDGDGEGSMEGLQQALSKLSEAEKKQMASRLLQGGRDNGQGDQRTSSGAGESGDFSQQHRDAGYGEGKGGGQSQGTPSARLRSTPYDAAISGARRGRAPSVDTQGSSRPGSFGAQLQYRGEIGQYRRQMEDAIAREQVPRDYHNQIRDYFKSLQE
jgi:hypothetical protein